MDKQTLKLIQGMPPEMLAAWEAKHPTIGSILNMVSEWRKLKHVQRYVLIFGGLGFLGAIIVAFVNPHSLWSSFILCIILVMILISFFYYPITPFMNCDMILDAFRDRLKDEKFDLMSCLEMGCGVKTFQAFANGRLEGRAIDVIDIEDFIARDRMDKSISEIRLLEELQELVRRRALFDETLSRAVEFGLSDGNSRPYFERARKRTERLSGL